jgi:predicted dehydrogenase
MDRRQFVTTSTAAALSMGLGAAGAQQDQPAAGKIRIAMLSMAHVHARGYADQVRNSADAELIAVWDEVPTRGQQAAKDYGVPFVADLGAALALEGLQGVVINAPTNLHHKVILEAIRAGKHVFTEKALTITTKESDEIVAAAEAAKTKFMISLPSRCSPEVLWLKQIKDQSTIGDATLMRARIAHSAALGGWFSGDTLWFADPVAAGGGALFDLGCHTVDVMRWIMGPPKRVTSLMNSFTQKYPKVDDNAVAVVEFESGALGILDVAWVQAAGPNPIELYGTKGFAGIRGLNGRPTLQVPGGPGADQQGNIAVDTLPPGLPGPTQQWIAAIKTGSEMTITVVDGRNLTEMLEGIYRSARTGKAIAYPLS